MQTEDLSRLIKNSPIEKPIVFSDEQLNLEVEDDEEIQYQNLTNFSITNLSDWFNSANVTNFTSIRKPSVSLSGVDPNEQLLLTVGMTRNEDGSEKRKIVIFDHADITPVLSLPAIDMQIYGNGFRMIHELNNNIFIKSYGIRVGLVVVFCNDIDDVIIPYSITRIKKKNTSVDLITNDPQIIRNKLSENLDFEALQLRYKQSTKAEGLITNLDAVKWLTNRQGTIEDVNHHIQIDNVIVNMLE